MPKIDESLKSAIAQKASDIHISSLEPIRFRIDGDLQVMHPTPLSPDEVRELLFEILTEEEQSKFIEHKNLDKSINTAEGHFRVNLFFTRRGPGAVLRTIPKKIPTIADLALPEAIGKLTDLPKGLVLVTGPTGSGKSTTLAAILNHINLHYQYHILTVEDPVEFVHESKKSLINQREIGTNCHTFADALKYALREDPDVILVGEMRDLETIALALTAAETGHLVFGTLHTRGAAASVDRIIDSFPANQQAMIRTMLSESLAAVVSQCLIKRAEGRGRAAAYEILIVNTAIANLIREGKTFQMPSIMQTARKEGMVLMEQSILELVQKKVVKAEDAATYLEDPAILGPHTKPSGTSPSISILTQSGPSIKSLGTKPPVPPPGVKTTAPPTSLAAKSVSAPKPRLVTNPVTLSPAPVSEANSMKPVVGPGMEQTATADDDLMNELGEEVPEMTESVISASLESALKTEEPPSDVGLALGLDVLPELKTENVELTDSPVSGENVEKNMLEFSDELMIPVPEVDTSPPPPQTKAAPVAKASPIPTKPQAPPSKAPPVPVKPASNAPPPPQTKAAPVAKVSPIPTKPASVSPKAAPAVNPVAVAPRPLPTRPGPPLPPVKKTG